MEEMMNNGDKPAMPLNRAPTQAEQQSHAINYPSFKLENVIEFGLTKRELFAAMAMQGLLGRSSDEVNRMAMDDESNAEAVARHALAYTEAFLTALEDNND